MTHLGMRANAISARVRDLANGSWWREGDPWRRCLPHDCPHYWATMAFRAGADVKAVQEAGG